MTTSRIFSMLTPARCPTTRPSQRPSSMKEISVFPMSFTVEP